MRVDHAAQGRCQDRRHPFNGHQQGEQLGRGYALAHITHHAHDHHQGQRTAQALEKAQHDQGVEAGGCGCAQRAQDEQQQAGQQRLAPAIGVDDGAEDQLAGAHGQQEEGQCQLHAGEACLIVAGDFRQARQVHVDGGRAQGADQA
ncbi:hypothetical protein D3C78_1459800 [compost metagenome]